MKLTTILTLLFLSMAGCATTRAHHASPMTVAATADAGTGGAKDKVADGPDSEISPEDLMKLLRGEADEPSVPTPKCDTPFCVTYLRLNGPILHGSTKTVLSKIVEAPDTAILMIDINTPGGSAGEGFELEKALEATHARVYCVVDGDAYSMGFFMLQSCQNRVMTKRSALMAHEPLMMASADEMLTIHDLTERIEDLNTDARGIAEQAISRMHITLEQYRAKTTGKNWFMAWPEALQVGAVDCVFAGTGAQAVDELRHTNALTCAK